MQFKNAFAKPFCVYSHIIKDEIIYIGSGPISRAFCTNRSRRWIDTTYRQLVTVKIMGWFDNRFDAFEHEGRLIDYHRPECNRTSVDGNGGARAFLPASKPPVRQVLFAGRRCTHRK